MKSSGQAGESTSLAAGVEADSALRRIRRRLQQRQQIALDIAQRRVVLEQRPVNLRRPLQHGGIGSEFLTQAYEGSAAAAALEKVLG